LESLDAAPPVTLATRSCWSSVLSSSSWRIRSSRDLSRSSYALTLTCVARAGRYTAVQPREAPLRSRPMVGSQPRAPCSGMHPHNGTHRPRMTERWRHDGRQSDGRNCSEPARSEQLHTQLPGHALRALVSAASPESLPGLSSACCAAICLTQMQRIPGPSMGASTAAHASPPASPGLRLPSTLL